MIRFLNPVLIFALAGCTGAAGDVVYKNNVDGYYSISEASVYAAAGAPVVVYGAPRDGASPAAVAAPMRLPAYLSSRELTAVDAKEAGRGLRVVLVFAPALAASSENVCAGRAKGGIAGPKLKVFGVFCTGTERAISEGILETTGSPTPSDPAFGAAMNALLQQLFPPVSPDDRDPCRQPGC